MRGAAGDAAKSVRADVSHALIPNDAHSAVRCSGDAQWS